MSLDTGLLRFLFPKTPLILKTAALNVLGLSPNAAKQDARTEITVNVLRSMMSVPSPLGKQQHITLKDPGIKGPMWIATVKLAAPSGQDDDLRELLAKAIEALKEGGETYKLPDVAGVEAEWTGHRGGVDATAPELDISEEATYGKLMDEVKSDITILYFHGGAY